MKKVTRRNKFRIIAGVAVITLSFGIACYIHSRNYVYTDDAYISGHSSYISPHVSGYVVDVNVYDNEIVKKGDLLLEIDPRSYQQKVNNCQAALEVAQNQYDADKQITTMEQAKVKFSLQEYYRYKKLSECHALSIESYQDRKSKLDQAVASLRAKLVQTKKDKASIKQAEAELSLAKLNLSYTRIYAPFDGWITKKTTALGDYVAPGTDLMAVVPTNLYIEANYKETKLTHLQKGQPVKIHIDAYPNKTFKGYVDSIQAGSGSAFSLLPPENATGNFVKITQRVPVKIKFAKTSNLKNHKLSIGMSVEVTTKIS